MKNKTIKIIGIVILIVMALIAFGFYAYYKFMSLNYIAIDFETANTYCNSACSVGLVRFEDGKETDSVFSLIRPPKLYFIPEWTSDIHHISYEDVCNQSQFPEVWNDLVLPFISKTPEFPFVAHKANFDMGVIRGCFEYFSLPKQKFCYFDSLKIARKTWPELKSHKLTFLGETFGIIYNAHEALDDARTCGKIVALAAQKHRAKTVQDLLSSCNLEMQSLE